MSAIPFFRSAFWMLVFSLALTVFAAIAGLENLDGIPAHRTLRAGTEAPAESQPGARTAAAPINGGPVLTGNVFTDRGPRPHHSPQWSSEIMPRGREAISPVPQRPAPAEVRTVSGPPARLMVVDDGDLRQIEPEPAKPAAESDLNWEQELPFADVDADPRPEPELAAEPQPAPIEPQRADNSGPGQVAPFDVAFAAPDAPAEAPAADENAAGANEPELADFDPFRLPDETRTAAEPEKAQPETLKLTGTAPAEPASDASAAESEAFDAVLKSEAALFASDADGAEPDHPDDLPAEVAPVRHPQIENAAVEAKPTAAFPEFTSPLDPFDSAPLQERSEPGTITKSPAPPETAEVVNTKVSAPVEQSPVPLDPFQMPAETRTADTDEPVAGEPEQPVTPLTSMLPRESRGVRRTTPAQRPAQPKAEGPWPPIQVVPGPAYGVRQENRGVPQSAATTPTPAPVDSPDAPVYTTAQRPESPRQAPAQQSLIMPPPDPQEELVKNLQTEIVRLQHQIDRLANANDAWQQAHENWVTVQEEQQSQLQELRENVDRLRSAPAAPTSAHVSAPATVPTRAQSMLSPDAISISDPGPGLPAVTGHPYDGPMTTPPRQITPLTTYPTATASHAGANRMVRPAQPQYIPRAAATCQCARCRAMRNEAPPRRSAFGLSWMKRFRIGN